MSKSIETRAADNIRILAASMVEKAKSGHPGAQWEAQILLTFYIPNF